MPRQSLGPWGRWYASTEEDTAHYTDRQFRAWAGIFGRAVRNRGELPKLRALRALYGEAVDFLVEEGRLYVGVENDVSIMGWQTYQAPIDRTNALRQARHRERYQQSNNTVETVTSPVSNGVTVTALPTSTSESRESPTENEDAELRAGARETPGYPTPGSDRDALDVYHELTGAYPWGRRPGGWIVELQEAHGVTQVVAAIEVEWRDKPNLKDLLGRVAARLERAAYRVAEASKREPRPVDPLQAEIAAAYEARYGEQDRELAADPTPEAIEAGRAVVARLRGMNGHERGGSARLGDLLGSSTGGSDPPGASPADDPALTVGEGSDEEPTAATSSDVETSDDPSPLSNRERLNTRPNRASPSRAADTNP